MLEVQNKLLAYWINDSATRLLPTPNRSTYRILDRDGIFGTVERMKRRGQFRLQFMITCSLFPLARR